MSGQGQRRRRFSAKRAKLAADVLAGERRGIVVHVNNVPFSLRNFIAGQPGFLRERGLDVHVICSAGELLEQFVKVEGVTAHVVPIHRKITPLTDLIALGRIVRILRRLDAVVVHAHTPKGGLLGMLGAWLAGTPVPLYYIHGLPFVTARGFRRFALVLGDKIACALAAQVICVSDSIRELLIEHGLCRANKAKVLLSGSSNGIDAQKLFNPANLDDQLRRSTRERYDIDDQALVLGFVGRIARDKGIVELVDAWRVLREEFANLHLVVVGPMENIDPIPADVENVLRTDPRVHLTGYMRATSIEELPALYDLMDVLAFPSYREGFGAVSIEAGAMNVPVVTTRIPGCIDAVVDGETGTLIPPRDAEALAAALRAYLRDPELRRRHGTAGRERVVRNYPQEAIWQAIYDEYCRLLAQVVPDNPA